MSIHTPGRISFCPPYRLDHCFFFFFSGAAALFAFAFLRSRRITLCFTLVAGTNIASPLPELQVPDRSHAILPFALEVQCLGGKDRASNRTIGLTRLSKSPTSKIHLFFLHLDFGDGKEELAGCSLDRGLLDEPSHSDDQLSFQPCQMRWHANPSPRYFH